MKMTVKFRGRLPGLCQWFVFNDKETVERTVTILNNLLISEFRILFSWADWGRPGGQDWFDYFVDRIANGTQARLIPALFYTPPDISIADSQGKHHTSYPPRDPLDYARFVEVIVKRYGQHFSWVQVWNEPNWKPYWNWDMDPDASLFSNMVTPAIQIIHDAGKRAALGGLSPYDPAWLTMASYHGLLEYIDAVGLHHSPSWTNQRRTWWGWDAEIDTARAHLRGLGRPDIDVWIAEAGYAPMGSGQDLAQAQQEQVNFFEYTRNADADKVIWYSAIDQQPEHLTDDQVTMGDERQEAAYHFGLETVEGTQKPLYEHWKQLSRTNVVHTRKETNEHQNQ